MKYLIFIALLFSCKKEVVRQLDKSIACAAPLKFTSGTGICTCNEGEMGEYEITSTDGLSPIPFRGFCYDALVGYVHDGVTQAGMGTNMYLGTTNRGFTAHY